MQPRALLLAVIPLCLAACESPPHEHPDPHAGHDGDTHAGHDLGADLGGDADPHAAHDAGPPRDLGVDVDHSAHLAPPPDAATADAPDGAEAPDVAPPVTHDLSVQLVGWSPSSERLSEFVVTEADGRQRARAVLRGNLADEQLVLPAVLPDAASRLWWWSDLNDNLDRDPNDRTGELPLSAPPGPHAAALVWERSHLPAAEPDAVAGSLSARFEDFEVHQGVTFSLRLTPEGDARTVAFYRYRSLSGASRFRFVLRGVLEEGRRYTASWYIDLNDNGVYDPRGDHGANLSFTGRATGVLLVHQHNLNRSWTE
jgi:hypothetical protein